MRLFRAPAVFRMLGLVDHADVRGYDLPAALKTHPRLHLTPDLARYAGAVKQRGSHGEIRAIGRDHRPREGAREPDGRARPAEGGDLVLAVEVFRDAP